VRPRLQPPRESVRFLRSRLGCIHQSPWRGSRQGTFLPVFRSCIHTPSHTGKSFHSIPKQLELNPSQILDATLSFFAFFSTRDSQTLSELAHKPNFVLTLLDILCSFTPTSGMKGDGLNQGMSCPSLISVDDAIVWPALTNFVGLKKDILALALSGLDATGLKATGIIRTDVAPVSIFRGGCW
jgi:hypothetical protein